jgi:hypothetical protein
MSQKMCADWQFQFEGSIKLTKFVYTGLFIIVSVTTNIYNKKTKGPNLMELFTATGKLIFFFWQQKMFNMCRETSGKQSEHLK